MASIKEEIIACVDKFVAEGGRIVADEWSVTLKGNKYEADEKEAEDDEGDGTGDYYPASCPLGTVLLAQDQREWLNETNLGAAVVLGVNQDWVRSFTLGFDGADLEDGRKGFKEKGDVDAFELGREFRTLYYCE